MAEISPLGRPNIPLTQNEPAPRGKPQVQARSNPNDKLDLSDEALVRSRSSSSASVREDLIARIRGEIAAGTYETPDKLDLAVDRLLEDIAG